MARAPLRLCAIFAIIAPCAALAQSPPGLSPMNPAADAINRIDPPAGDWAIAPNISVSPDGAILLSWLERVTDEPADRAATGNEPPEWRLRFARFADGRWSEPRTVMQRTDVFANWADLPLVTESDDGMLLAHWLQSSGPHVYAYDVMLARSADDGRTWATLGPAHDDGTQTEHGFVSAVRENDNESRGVRLFWLDGREMKLPDHDDDDPHAHSHGDMQLRTALFTDSIGTSIVLDHRVCECCDTDAALTSEGPIVVYRDRTADEVRDISIVRRVNGEWTKPKPVHEDGWKIAGCPVNGPAVAARGRTVAVAWYTGAEFSGRVQVAFSHDAGASFDEPIVLEGDTALGRVAIDMTSDGAGVVGWLSADAYGGVIRAQGVTPDGPNGDRVDIARTNPGRHSGFPKFALIDDETALFVWTHAGRPSRLRAARVAISDDGERSER